MRCEEQSGSERNKNSWMEQLIDLNRHRHFESEWEWESESMDRLQLTFSTLSSGERADWAELSWGCWLFLLFLVAYLAYWKRPSGQSEAKQRPKPPSAAINFKNVAGQRTRRWLKSKTPLLPLPLPLLSLLLCCCCCCSAAVAVAVAAAAAGGNTFANP